MDKRKAKIVCTPGSASARKKIIGGMIKEGMDVARVNLIRYECIRGIVHRKRQERPVLWSQDECRL